MIQTFMQRFPNTAAISHILLLILAISGTATAIDYDEAVDGDLSGDPSAPTPFPLSVGDNLLTATSASGDIEYFLATVPSGHELTGIFLEEYSNSFGFSFLALQPGTVFTEPPIDTDPANLLGYYLFGGDDLGTDILDDMAMAVDAQGFTPPLPAADFTFWSQETAAAVTYTYRFQVTPVPEPGGCAILLTLCSIPLRRRFMRG